MRMDKGILAGILGLTLLLGGCGQRGDQALSGSAPAAELAGEETSPDGRFRAETGETFRIVEVESGETVWEEDGFPWQSVVWAPEGPTLVAVAYGDETGKHITVAAPETGKRWDFVLPDGSPLPGETVLPEDWCRWEADAQLDITVDQGTGDETFRCVLFGLEGELTGVSLLLTEEALPESYDFDRDGAKETVLLRTLHGTDAWRRYLETGDLAADGGNSWELALREGESPLWRQEGFSLAHAGWGSVFACRLEGQDCLLTYYPYMSMGWLSFQYQLFYLTEDGEPVMLDELSLNCDCNDNAKPEDRMDPAAMAAFLERVHGYLENATLLLSTEGGAWHQPGSAGVEFRDDYATFWNADRTPYDESLSLEENLRNSWVMREG